MFYFRPHDPKDALLVAKAIQVMRTGGDDAAIMDELDLVDPPGSVHGRQNLTASTLQMFFLDSVDYTVCLFGAVNNARMGLAVNNSYFDPPNENPGLGEQVALANIALNTFTGPVASPAVRGRRVLVAGYSGGAAVSMYVAASFRALRPTAEVVNFQFAPPRSAVREYASRVPSFASFRYHCSEDPIAHIPLWPGESNLQDLISSPQGRARASRYVSHAQGFALSANGQVISLAHGTAPPTPSNLSTLALGWLSGLWNDAVAAHSLPELIRRLSTFSESSVDSFALCGVGIGSLPNITPGVALFPRPEESETQRAAAAAGPEAPAVIRGRGEAAAVVDPRTRDVPFKVTRKPFYQAKWNGQQWVMHTGTPLIHCANRREARKRAGNLNALAALLARTVEDDADLVGTALAIEGQNN